MDATNLPLDPTLDEVRAALTPALARNAAFDGWSHAAVDMTAAQIGVVPGIARLAFDGGAIAMIDAWFSHIDAAMIDTCPPELLATMKVRERIATLVETRLNLLAPNKEALRRALAILTMPQNLPRATRLGWRAADVMWRAAGDNSVDFNYYSKRTLLAGIYSATLLVFLDDDSEVHVETSAFLGRRINDVMRFEKTRTRLTERAGQRPSLARFLGRLRYRTR